MKIVLSSTVPRDPDEVYFKGMRKILKFWKILLFDLIGVLLMLLAIATGWLPGPGGIPLFIIGLSILAIHHEWAQKYIDHFKEIVENIGKRIFNNNKHVQLTYDLISPPLIIGGIYLLWLHNATWQITVSIFMIITGITVLLGNRNRFHRAKARFKKHKY